MERVLVGEADRAENLMTDRRDSSGSLTDPDARGVERPGLGRVEVSRRGGRLRSHGHRTRLAGELGELLLHSLHRRQRLAELTALAGVPRGVGVDALRRSGHEY